MRAEQNKTLEFFWDYDGKFSGSIKKKKNTTNYEKIVNFIVKHM